MLESGDTAPDFTLPDQDGKPHTLSAYRGKTVVLYWYPKADTRGLKSSMRWSRLAYMAAPSR